MSKPVTFTYRRVVYRIAQFFMLDGAPAALGTSASGRSVTRVRVADVQF